MTEEQVYKGNKLIAKLMGGKYKHTYDPTYITFSPVTFAGLQGAWSCHDTALYFDSDWSWIMPAARKALSLYHDRRSDIFSALHKCDIDALFIAVVTFLEWYRDCTEEEWCVCNGYPFPKNKII